MLKLNASFSKKVPAETDYSSKSYHASIEVEIPDGLSQEQLQTRIHQTFELVRNSVEAELNGNAQPLPLNQPAVMPAPENNTAEPEAASPKQVKYLMDLSRKNNIDLTGYLQNYGLTDVKQLNRQQCSYLIDQVRGKRAA